MPKPWNETSREVFDHTIDERPFALSDVISFHSYCGPRRLAGIIDQLETFRRPLVITVWMARLIATSRQMRSASSPVIPAFTPSINASSPSIMTGAATSAFPAACLEKRCTPAAQSSGGERR
jgi:hypothetical protein